MKVKVTCGSIVKTRYPDKHSFLILLNIFGLNKQTRMMKFFIKLAMKH